MKRSTVLAVFVVIILLFTGWLLFRVLNSAELMNEEDGGFSQWFWEKRSLDLVIQIALVFAGALGIAAILPIEENDG